MDSNSSSQTPVETLKGTLEKIRFSNEDGSWSIAVLHASEEPTARTRRMPSPGVTIVGDLSGAQPGQQLSLEGQWIQHPTYGRQFQIEHIDVQAPINAEGIRKYLGGGMIKGIGKKMAERLVDAFGDDTLDVIDQNPERLREVRGVGKKLAAHIEQAWAEQREVRNVMVFLHSHGVTTAYASKIFKAYGKKAIAEVKNNPYKLARDIHGIGFKLSDRIAQHLGIVGSDPRRVQAGVTHVLYESRSQGHLYLPTEELTKRASEYLGVSSEDIAHAVETLEQVNILTLEPVPPEESPTGHGHVAIYARRTWEAEMDCADELTRLLHGSQVLLDEDALDLSETTLTAAERELGVQLAPAQRKAIRTAIEERIVVITGGPGTGKTTIVRAICTIAQSLDWELALAAPTGRAAKRMHEATDIEAKTLHRLLEYSFQAGFQRNAENPIDADFIIVDEASMIDIYLMRALLNAIASGASLILVGDVDQLPSVGPGDVLADLIRSERLPVCRLDAVFRQAAESAIVRNAHRINRGQVPEKREPNQDPTQSDFFIIRAKDSDDALAKTLKVTTERLPKAFGFDPHNEIQIIAPMHRGPIGCQRLNRELQKILNTHSQSSAHIQRGENHFRVGDRVMQMRNNYDKNVFNGDIGHITAITKNPDDDGPSIHIEIEGREILYELSELDEITLAYAITAHKSQGSEYPAVVIVLTTAHYVLLERNLVYTALTRARKIAVIIAMDQAMRRAVTNATSRTRFTRLAVKIRDASKRSLYNLDVDVDF